VGGGIGQDGPHVDEGDQRPEINLPGCKMNLAVR
jgi:hypothetical protein